MAAPNLTAERLREVLSYDPETGIFTRLIDRGKFKAGERAGSVSPTGYRVIGVDRALVLEHRLAWLCVYGEWPDGEIDHINRIRVDNRIENLRLAHGQNARNIVGRGASGFKGVYQFKPGQKWRARIFYDGKLRHLGSFDTPEEAHAAYCAAAIRHHGVFANAEHAALEVTEFEAKRSVAILQERVKQLEKDLKEATVHLREAINAYSQEGIAVKKSVLREALDGRRENGSAARG